MKYTLDNLKQQLSNAKMWLASTEMHLTEISSPDWAIAKTYGEDVRREHVKTVLRNIKHYETIIFNLKDQIQVRIESNKF